MIPRSLVEKLTNTYIYVYVKGINQEFGGKLEAITDDDILVIKTKANNNAYIPISEITVITERQ